MRDTIIQIEGEIGNNSGGAAGKWPVGNTYSKSAVERKAIPNLKNLGNGRRGYREWHDKLVNAMAPFHREYRVIPQMIVKAIDREETLSTGGVEDWQEWVNETEIMTIDLKE